MVEFDFSPLWISLKTALTATVITFCLGIAAARWMVGYRGRGKGWIDGLFTLPLVLPPTVVGFFLLLLFGKNGPLGQLLSPFGINVVFSWTATVIAATVVAFPLMYKTARAAFEQIDPNLLGAARTLGATEGKIFWQITLPLARPGIIAGTILAFARALGEFGATLMLAGNIPGKTQTIAIAIFFADEAGSTRQALAWVLIMVAISLAGIAGLNYWSDFPQSSTGARSRHVGRAQGLAPLPDLTCEAAFRARLDTSITSPTLPQASTSFSSLRPSQHLQVEIQKQLPEFELAVAFRAGNDPLGLLGASGSGKSMTLRCIAGLETPTQGRIVLNQRVLFDAKQGINLPSRQRRIGYLFQNYALFPHMTVAQNIAFGLQKLPQREQAQRVAAQLALVQIQNLADRYPEQLSGGQQQRVALARALAIAPEALLLDEPFSALDTHLRSQIEKQLSAILANYAGITLFVTHNLEEAYRLCHDLLVLADGEAIAHSSKQEIFERPKTFAVAQLTGCKNFSRAQMISANLVEAVDWGCRLHVVESIPHSLAYVGIRAHHLSFPANGGENTLPCWLVQTSETQHRMTLYLKLNHPPDHAWDHHLQVEVFKERWSILKDRPLPWQVHLDPLRLFLMEE